MLLLRALTMHQCDDSALFMTLLHFFSPPSVNLRYSFDEMK
jgi:hypothetical protein